MFHLWTISNDSFDPRHLHHKETIFTIGNGYLSTRGAFEEGYPGDRRATFIHGVFDEAPIVLTELANAPDWLPLTVLLNGERFSLTGGTAQAFEQTLDLRTGVLTRTVRWRSPSGRVATLTFERFASLADPHTLFLRCRVTPEFEGTLEFRAALNGNTDNDVVTYWLAHWCWVGQGIRDGVGFLLNRTRRSKIDVACAMRLNTTIGRELARDLWDVENRPTLVVKMEAVPGQEVIVDKHVAVFTSRDVDAQRVVDAAVERVSAVVGWTSALKAQVDAWAEEWARTDVVIEGDDQAQLAIRFNLFQMLIAAPRHDDRVNIGAKTLSGFGYRGHSFWDTEIFMLPLFTYTAPHIARNLLNYRYRNLPAARRKARANGFEGAQFPWESADTGDEVTPTWLPHFADKTRLVRIWTGDIEIHISADIAYATYQYWQVTGDDEWFIDKGAELILDTARFWASRAEWNADARRYDYNDVIGPDENHEHVDNNFFTNRMAQWNLQTALGVLDWLEAHAPAKAAELGDKLSLDARSLAHWRDVVEKMYLPVDPSGLIEQFEGYFRRRDVDLAALEPRTRSMQEVFGIEGANEIRAIKQPDVLMLLYLLGDHYSSDVVRVNYDYYTPRTDHTYGSSTGPPIQAIMACEVGKLDEAYDHFIRAARADLRDVRGNAGDGIHAASAAGTWQAVVFGFAGLRVTPDGWTTRPRLPKHWKRLAFKFFHRGKLQEVDIEA
ncbi:MAG TPA: glycoside hydrolase family 65 protein [Anaerolineae bacterium]|nr:glycoside hydrolase family 65 protein [Anaerolineae bacterium]